MVGVCGTIGQYDHNLDSIKDSIIWSSDESQDRYTSDKVDLLISTHESKNAKIHSFQANGGKLISVWGDITGHESSGSYVAKNNNRISDAEYCANLYSNHGQAFVDGLNSEFAGVIVDQSEPQTTVFTDRLGARPIYYTDTIDGAFLFSTHLNTILSHPAVDVSINDELLVEFLMFERVLGTKTPFTDIKQVHPGSRLSYHPSTDSTDRTIYWVPHHNPIDRSKEESVEHFARIFEKAVKERQTNSDPEGILISGGSDSRLLLSSLRGDIIGFYMNETMNEEAKIAKRVCDIAGAKFEFLERKPDYQSTVLSEVGDMQLYSSFFDQAHAIGFKSEISNRVSELHCGQYSDTILSGHYLPNKILQIPFIDWSIELNSPRRVESINDYIDYMFSDFHYMRESRNVIPEYIDLDVNIEEIVKSNITKTTNGINHHGVTYPSFDALSIAGAYYPLTNAPSYLFYYSLNQMTNAHYPFLDNRIIDFALSLPSEKYLKLDVVNKSLQKDRKLAQIPHADSGVPLNYPAKLQALGKYWIEISAKFGINTGDRSSWSDHDQVIRKSNIIQTHLKPECGSGWDALNDDEVKNLIESHFRGEDNYIEIYGLLSLINSYPFAGYDLMENSHGVNEDA